VGSWRLALVIAPVSGRVASAVVDGRRCVLFAERENRALAAGEHRVGRWSEVMGHLEGPPSEDA